MNNIKNIQLKNSIYIGKYIIDVDYEVENQNKESAWIDIYVDYGEYISVDKVCEMFDSFHGKNYSVEEAIAGVNAWK